MRDWGRCTSVHPRSRRPLRLSSQDTAVHHQRDLGPISEPQLLGPQHMGTREGDPGGGFRLETTTVRTDANAHTWPVGM